MNTIVQRAIVLFFLVSLNACWLEDDINCGLDETQCEDYVSPPPEIKKNLYPLVGMDGSGNAVAVWYVNPGENEGVNEYPVASSYTPSNGWGSVVPIGAENEYSPSPQLAMDSSGTAIAIWSQPGGFLFNRYTSNTGWTGANTLDTGDYCCRGGEIAMDGNGNAVAIWLIWSPYDVWTARYAPSTGWSVPESIDTDITPYAPHTSVAMSSDGSAVLVWTQIDEDGVLADIYSIWANRYSPGSGWGGAELVAENLEIETGSAGLDFKVDMDAGGNIIVAWSFRDNIWARNYVTDTGWSSAEPVTGDAGVFFDLNIDTTPDGKVIAVWRQLGNIWVNFFEPATGWGIAQEIITSDYSLQGIKIAMDDFGNVVVVWGQSTQTSGTNEYWKSLYKIWSMQYAEGSGWETAQLISASEVDYCADPDVAIDNNGNAVAVWMQAESVRSGDTEIWSNRYSSDTGWGSPTFIGK